MLLIAEGDYIASKANTRLVNENGKTTQNHSGNTTKKPIIIRVDTKNIIQYLAVDFFSVFVSMLFYFY